MARAGRTRPALAAILCWLAGLQPAGAEQLNPIEKTIELLTQLQATVVRDGEEEQASYAKYASWCSNSAQVKRHEIKTATREKTKLEAEIQESSSDISEATAKIEELSKTHTTAGQKLEAATQIRKSEKSTFKTAEQELSQSINMLDKAIRVMEKKGGANFMQVKGSADTIQNVLMGLRSVIEAAGLEVRDQQKLASLLERQQQADDGEDAVGAPDSQAYKSNSQGLIELMEDIRDQAEVQLKNCRESETNAQHNYALLKQSLENEVEQAENEMSEEKGNKASAAETKSSAEGNLAIATKELKESSKALEDIQTSCMQTASDHETAVKGRQAELKALQSAKALIQSTMSGSLIQRTYSFLQTSQLARNIQGAQYKARAKCGLTQAIQIVKRLAVRQQSADLAQLTSRLNAVARYTTNTNDKGPFKKVKAMIEDMVAKMQKQLSADEEEHIYCVAELKKTKDHHESLTDANDGLKAKIDQLVASSVNIQGQVQELQAELAELERLQQSMDDARESAHEAYLKATADLQQGLDGTRSAIRVLRDYYASDEQDEGAAMLQTDESLAGEMHQPAPPPGHARAKGAGGGIISLLEVVESDLARNLAQAETEEDGEVAEHEKIVQENKVLKASKEKDAEYKSKEHKTLEKEITDLTSDYDTSTSELEAVSDYWAKVKEQCDENPERYRERQRRREEQIKGLQEAMRALSSLNSAGTSGFLQQRNG